MANGTASLAAPIRRFLKGNKNGGHLLQAFDWEATHYSGEYLEEIELERLLRRAAIDAARRNPERPLDQRRAHKQYFQLFEDLERSGWGKVMLGRRGQKTRLVCRPDLTARKLAQVMKACGVERRSLDKNETVAPGREAEQVEAPSPLDDRGKLRRDEVVSLLRAHAEDFKRRGVKALSLFGSLARDEARPDSDVDLLVAFEGSVTSDMFFDTKFFLEDLLSKRIDLVTESALRDRIRRAIEPELIRVA